jgi:hypothetical protein
VIECVNSMGDIGAAARSFAWKMAKAEQLGATLGEPTFRIHGCWVVRVTRRNRELVRRYPQVFKSRFPGSSAGWVRALTNGAQPPMLPGLVWCDVAGSRLFEWRAR